MMDGAGLTNTPPAPAPPMLNAIKQEKKLRSFTVQQLEDMKVAELKEELKARKEKVRKDWSFVCNTRADVVRNGVLIFLSTRVVFRLLVLDSSRLLIFQ